RPARLRRRSVGHALAVQGGGRSGGLACPTLRRRSLAGRVSQQPLIELGVADTHHHPRILHRHRLGGQRGEQRLGRLVIVGGQQRLGGPQTQHNRKARSALEGGTQRSALLERLVEQRLEGGDPE